MIFSALFTGLITGLGIIVAIGAQNAYVLRMGLIRQHVSLVVTICILSDVVMMGVGIGGAGALFHNMPRFAEWVRLIGAVFLISYGVISLRRALQGGMSLTAGQAEPQGWFHVALTCLAFTFLNPHFYLDTLVLMGSLSLNYKGAGALSFYIGVSCASIMWFLMLGYGARLLIPLFRKPRAWRALDSVIGVMMLGLSMILITEAI